MSEGEIESLVATRKRRSNAGSRLKQLLQAEEIANDGADDDNDIDLLFQEDDDDAEFQVGDKDRYGYVGSGDEDEEEDGDEEEQADSEVEGEGSDEENQREGTTTPKETTVDSDNSDAGSQVDLDDMFSDSEDEDSDEDDSDEGERELQKQERAKKRLAQKKSRQIPKITTKPKTSTTTALKKKKVHDSPKADTLLNLSRRQSSRKTAVQSKMDLVERLKEDEQRRQNIKPVAKVEYVELTQEERLAEAIETEKYNISTLNKYKEQEVDKKKKQRALQLSRRKKLENVVSFKTCPIFVTPVQEHELELFLMTRDTLKRKRDRRGRKSEKQKREEEEARQKEEERKKRASMFIIRPRSVSEETDSQSKKVVIEEVDSKSSVEATSEVEPRDEPVITDGDALKGQIVETEMRKDDEVENEKKRPSSTDDTEERDAKKLKTEDEESDNDIVLVSLKDEKRKDDTSGAEDNVVESDDAKTEEAKDEDKKNEANEGDQKIEANEEDQKVEAKKEDSRDEAKEEDKRDEATEEIKEDEAKEEKESTNELKSLLETEEAEATGGEKDSTQTAVTEQPKEDIPAVEESKSEHTGVKQPTEESTVKPEEEGKMDVDAQDITIKTEVEADQEKPIKSVKFADDEELKIETKPETPSQQDAEPSSSRETSIIPEEEEHIVFAGPAQKVAANFISFEESTKNYTIDEIKAYLFGPQSLLPAFRKSQEVEPILRVRADAVSEDDDQVQNEEDLPNFEFLDSFPKFGEFNKVRKEQVVLETREDIKVVLKTQPPTGVHLPNGTKKQCLITGKPAMYFDPKTGLPYGSVEAYKVIKDIQNGKWAWTEFPGGGAYVCNRENTVHAKGVPEGFDD